MPTTFVDYRDKGFWAHDAVIEVFLYFLCDEIGKLPTVPPWLQDAKEEWYLQATVGFGFGVLPGLDDFATNDERRDLVVQLSKNATERLATFGDCITAEQLNSLGTGGSRSYFTADLPTKMFLEFGSKFVNLLQGILVPDGRETIARRQQA